MIFFLLCLLIFTELTSGQAGEASVLLFKQGSKANLVKEAEAAVDSEKAEADSTSSTSQKDDRSPKKEVEASENQPKMVNTFSWQHINYTVSVAGGNRLLLDDVSGFVSPGKLTALMGESGAGKVHIIGNKVVIAI